MVVCAIGGQPRGLSEDVPKRVQEFHQEGVTGCHRPEAQFSSARHARPAHRAPVSLEGHGLGAKIPEHRPQRRQTLGTEHQIVSGQRHHEEVGAERVVADDDGACRRTPGHVTRSPFATVAVSRGRRCMGSPERRAASSAMKLCVEPESRSTVKTAAPTDTLICMVSRTETPAITWREMCGDSSVAISSSATSSSGSSSMALSRRNSRLQTLLWPAEFLIIVIVLEAQF